MLASHIQVVRVVTPVDVTYTRGMGSWVVSPVVARRAQALPPLIITLRARFSLSAAYNFLMHSQRSINP